MNSSKKCKHHRGIFHPMFSFFFLRKKWNLCGCELFRYFISISVRNAMKSNYLYTLNIVWRRKNYQQVKNFTHVNQFGIWRDGALWLHMNNKHHKLGKFVKTKLNWTEPKSTKLEKNRFSFERLSCVSEQFVWKMAVMITSKPHILLNEFCIHNNTNTHIVNFVFTKTAEILMKPSSWLVSH